MHDSFLWDSQHTFFCLYYLKQHSQLELETIKPLSHLSHTIRNAYLIMYMNTHTCIHKRKWKRLLAEKRKNIKEVGAWQEQNQAKYCRNDTVPDIDDTVKTDT